jgi:nucleoid-associated protein YgaU
VARGDTLWAIAAAQLGPGATDAQVVARWHDLYARNAAVIGGDPDLLLPGQLLGTCG